MRRYHFLVALGVFLLDQATKWLILRRIPLHESVPVIPGLFQLTHVQNRGAAFGLFSDFSSEWAISVLILFSLIALAVVWRLLWRNSHALSATGIALALVLGGALGNLWDRLVDGHVVDYLDVFVGTYHWPAFNVADSAIVVGAVVLVGHILFSKAHAEEKPVAGRS